MPLGQRGDEMEMRSSTRRTTAWRIATLVLVAAALLDLGAAAPTAAARSDGLARTPPMGWSTFMGLNWDYDEHTIQDTADLLVSSGMRDAGYTYVNIDGGWLASSRDAQGNLIPDPEKFPSGMKALADYIHSKGLKFGMYTDEGTLNCANNRPGSLGYERQDAALFASWGVDYVKVDWCNNQGLDPQIQYTKWRDAISASGRAMVLSICDWGLSAPWLWGPRTGHLWRTTGDISDTWESMTSNLDTNALHAASAGPGAWNDPDFILAGLRDATDSGMSDVEYRAQFTLWAIMAAPLIVSSDLRSLSEATRDTLTNPEVISVDQDPAGIQGDRVKTDGDGHEVWSKRLAQEGERAVALFNRGATSTVISVAWSDLGLTSDPASVRDLWAREDLGVFSDGYAAVVPSHGAVLLEVKGDEAHTPAPRLDASVRAPTIVAPEAGAWVHGDVRVSVAVDDEQAISKVELYKDARLFATRTTAPYSFDWDTAADSLGTHVLHAKAYDAAGNVALSVGVPVAVVQGSGAASLAPFFAFASHHTEAPGRVG